MGASKRSIAGKFASMRADAIRVRQDRCAKVRNRNVACLKCAEACTSGCISIVDDELVIDSDKCVGCGTCATVCPTCALESVNPTDAELTAQCARAAREGRCTIACSALAGEEAFADAAKVTCLGRVDESTLAALAAQGTVDIELACGSCERCAQRVGEATAHLVAETANDLFDAFGSSARVHVEPHEMAGDFACAPLVEQAGASWQNVLSGSDFSAALPHVMKDGTLPHFLPNRRERLLDSLSQLRDGEPKRALNNRLWGCVVIDGTKCTSCRMCATFCPTGAIRKFDNDDGIFGVMHFPGDCVKCGSCRDICPEGAILLLDEVKPRYLMDGEVHRYTMKPRDVEIDNPQQILNTMKTLIPGNLYER